MLVINNIAMSLYEIHKLYFAPAPNMHSHRLERAAVSLELMAADASPLSGGGAAVLGLCFTEDTCCIWLSSLWMRSCTQRGGGVNMYTLTYVYYCNIKHRNRCHTKCM